MEDWKDDILNSTKGMAKAHPPIDAFNQIQKKIRDRDNVAQPSMGWMAIAAAVSLIVLFNAYFIASYSSNADASLQNNTGSYTSLVSSYNLYENDK